MSEYWQAFSVFDLDGDGTISTEELGNVMKSLGQNLTQDEVLVMIRQIDEDGKLIFIIHHSTQSPTLIFAFLQVMVQLILMSFCLLLSQLKRKVPIATWLVHSRLLMRMVMDILAKKN